MGVPQTVSAPDYVIENHGSIVLVRPQGPQSRQHLEAVTSGMWYGSALVVELRYLDALVAGLTDEGFVVQ